MESPSQLFGAGDHHDKEVSVDMMDYKYIDDCNDVKVLEKILRALRSGQSGYYPHLVKHCEEKVTRLNPKSRALRTEKHILKSRDLPDEEASEIFSGMNEWINNMNQSENLSNGLSEKDLPPIRTTSKISKDTPSTTTKKSTKRIRGNDFQSWDKYDAEAECKKVDESEKAKPKKSNANISHHVDSTKMSEEEKQICAGQEKDKGNEAFKAGDFDEALAYYSRSMSLMRTAASINNRALAYLRLERWSDAEKDCNEVLGLEPENLKAKLRRATALKELKRFDQARSDVEFVLKKEPNNLRAKKMLGELKSNHQVKKGRKMKIMEVEETEEEASSPDNETKSHFQNNSTPSPERTVSPQSQNGSADDSHQPDGNSLTSLAEINTEDSDRNDQEPISKPSSSTNEKLLVKEECQEVIHTPLPEVLQEMKEAAGICFRAGQYANACDKYSVLISRLTSTIDANPDANYSHALATLYNNRAACQLKSGNDRSCIADCSKVLELKPTDIKALIRRACAYEHMEKYRLAYEDFRAAQGIDWSANQAQDGANRVAKHLRDVYGSKWKEESSSVPYNADSKSIGIKAQDAGKPKKQVTSKINPKKSMESSSSATKASNTNKSSKPLSEKKKVAPEKKTEKPNAEAIEEKREKIRQDLYSKLKLEGNDLFKKGNYTGALESYTKCIQLCPKEIASYTNRALCFLKLNKDLSASHDCTEAINLDPCNVKAYYRRAQANKNLKLYKEADKDYRRVLELDPKNKFAASEMSSLKKYLDSPPKRKVPILEVSDEEDSSDEEPAPSENFAQLKELDKKVEPTVGGKLKTETGNRSAGASEKLSLEQETVQSDGDRISGGGPSGKAGTPRKSEQNETIVNVATNPTSLHVSDKLTPYEFGNLWNSIHPKTNVAAFKCILDKVPVEQIPSMVSNKIDDHMIVMFAHIAQSHVKSDSASESNRAYNLLLYLSKAQRFDMAAMFLSKSDKNIVGEALAGLANNIKTLQVSYSFPDVNKLQKLYEF